MCCGRSQGFNSREVLSLSLAGSYLIGSTKKYIGLLLCPIFRPFCDAVLTIVFSFHRKSFH